MSNTAALLLVLLVVAAANVVVSVGVIKSHYYDPKQKAVQTILVWVIPLFGAIGVGVFLYSQRGNPMYDTRAYPEPDKKAVPVEIQDAIQGHGNAD
jgi:hypothetical protein